MSDDTEKSGSEQQPNFDGVEEQINSLHDSLDSIKDAGKQISKEVEEELPEDATKEQYMEAQYLMSKANLLTRRVESGDKNVVRGE